MPLFVKPTRNVELPVTFFTVKKLVTAGNEYEMIPVAGTVDDVTQGIAEIRYSLTWLGPGFQLFSDIRFNYHTLDT